MTEKLTEIATNRLALIRQLFLYAVEQSTGAKSLRRRIISVIAFDLAVENALRLTVLTLDPNFKPDREFTHPNLVNHLNGILAKQSSYPSLPQTSGVAYLHHVRNDAQHNGRYPSEDEVSECRAHARAFLTALVNQIWGIAFESISLTGLIRNKETRDLLQQSEEAMRRNDLVAAIKTANAGLSWLISGAGKEFFPRSAYKLWQGSGPVQWNIDSGEHPKPKLDPTTKKELDRLKKEHTDEVRNFQHKLDGLREQVKDEFDSLEEPLLCSLLGINYSSYMHFRRLAGYVQFNAGVHNYSISNLKEPVSPEEAEFVFAFCTDAALQIEAEASIPEEV